MTKSPRPHFILLTLLLCHSALAAAPTTAPSSTIPAPNPKTMNSPLIAAQKKLAQAGGFDVLFVGDSITEWFAKPGSPTRTGGRQAWDQFIAPHFKAANFGLASDRTENVLWRFDQGILAGKLNPRVIVLLIGVNNCRDSAADQIAPGVQAVLRRLTAAFPRARILLLAVFPVAEARDTTGQKAKPINAAIDQLNPLLAQLDDGKQIRFHNLSQIFLKDGKADPDLYSDPIHLNIHGYKKWAQALLPLLQKSLTAESP